MILSKALVQRKDAFAPVVEDLSVDGFPLVGARIDVIGLEPAANSRLSPRHASDQPDGNAKYACAIRIH